MSTPAPRTLSRHFRNAPVIALTLTAVLMIAAMLIPLVFGWDVNARAFPPLNSLWRPRFGPGTLPAAAIGIVAVAYAGRIAESASWPRLLGVVFVAGLAWLTSLATVDGWAGIGDILNSDYEYLQTARSTTDISATLHEFIDRIPLHSPDNWTTHVAGHPPGALLFFVLLVRSGLGSGLAAGWVVLILAATTPVAVMSTSRRLGAESAARRVAPFLVFGPAAIWSAVSADAMFGACTAWGLCCLAIAATTTHRVKAAIWAIASGVLLGYCVMLSYGLPLVGLLAVAVLVSARSSWPLPWAALSASAVVLAFAAAGFAWWDAFPVLRERYYDSIAKDRPASYWVWGDLAALAFSAGPLVGPALAASMRRATTLGRDPAPWYRPVVLLTCASTLAIALADLSFMSKAETERIWLPFVPWLLLGCSMLSDTWRRRGLVAQVVFALVVQTLLFTRW